MESTNHFDLTKEKKLIIEVELEERGSVNIRIDSSYHDFSFVISPDALKKLAVCINRYFQKAEQGCFYYDKFLIGLGSAQKEYPAKEILSQHGF